VNKGSVMLYSFAVPCMYEYNFAFQFCNQILHLTYLIVSAYKLLSFQVAFIILSESVMGLVKCVQFLGCLFSFTTERVARCCVRTSSLVSYGTLVNVSELDSFFATFEGQENLCCDVRRIRVWDCLISTGIKKYS
jgi:hypothetical protein